MPAYFKSTYWQWGPDRKSAAEFKAASDIRFDICDDPDDGACKRILENHLVWSPNQYSRPERLNYQDQNY
jgi:hypothetical protein